MPLPLAIASGWTEALGWLAAGLTLLGFTCRDMRWLRGLALAASAAFIAYGLSAQLLPVLVLHAALVPIHAWRLVQAAGVGASGSPRPALPPTATPSPPVATAPVQTRSRCWPRRHRAVAALMVAAAAGLAATAFSAAWRPRPSSSAAAPHAAHPSAPRVAQTGPDDRDAHILFVPRPDWAALRRTMGPTRLVIDLVALESPEAARLLADSARARAGAATDIDCWLRADGQTRRSVLDAAAALASRDDDAPPPCNRIRIPDAS